jgi:peptidoglycan/LPS O-acetylase OafA/YrhL
MNTRMRRAPYFPQLDGLRAIAILLVIAGHELFGTRFQQVATLGVLLFFALSGFLITTLLLHEEATFGSVSLPAFYMRRGLRILPAMWFFIAAMTVLWVMGTITDVPRYEFAVCLLYLRNIFGRSSTLAHLWSLSLEEQFYLLWPLILVILRPAARLRAAAFLVITGCVWRGVAIAGHLFDYNMGIVYERTDFRFDSVLSGCVLAIGLVRHEAALRRWFVRLPKVTDAVLLLGLLALNLKAHAAWFVPFDLTLQTVLATLLLGRLVTAEGGVTRDLLAASPMRWLGRLSYSWYLWQQPFIMTRPGSWGILRVRPLDAVASLVLAAFSYYVVERPFLRLKSRFDVPQSPVGLPAVLG